MSSKNLNARISALEKLARKSGGVGVVLPRDGRWSLFFNGREADFPTEEAAIAAFYQKASHDSTLIIW